MRLILFLLFSFFSLSGFANSDQGCWCRVVVADSTNMKRAVVKDKIVGKKSLKGCTRRKKKKCMEICKKKYNGISKKKMDKYKLDVANYASKWNKDRFLLGQWSLVRRGGNRFRWSSCNGLATVFKHAKPPAKSKSSVCKKLLSDIESEAAKLSQYAKKKSKDYVQLSLGILADFNKKFRKNKCKN